MRAGRHLTLRRLVAIRAAGAEQRCGERVCQVGATGAGRAGDQPGVRHRRFADRRPHRRRLGGSTEDGDRFGLAGQFIPHRHGAKPKGG